MSEYEYDFAAGAVRIADQPAFNASVATHPDEVLKSPSLTVADKRAILASWASDARAVVGRPTLRQLPSGAVVRLYEIQRALAELDRIEGRAVMDGRRPATAGRRWIARWLARKGPARRDDDDDDDDPPPLPALSGRPPVLQVT